jgi:hypothetical protein
MIVIEPLNEAHALLVIRALNEWLQTGFIGGVECNNVFGWLGPHGDISYGDGYGFGWDYGNGYGGGYNEERAEPE